MYNDEPWFIAKDVCDILDIDDPSKAVSRIDDDERGTTTVRTAGGPQEMLTLNESGVYMRPLSGLDDWATPVAGPPSNAGDCAAGGALSRPDLRSL